MIVRRGRSERDRAPGKEQQSNLSPSIGRVGAARQPTGQCVATLLEHLADPVGEGVVRVQAGRFQDMHQVPVVGRDAADFDIERGLHGCYQIVQALPQSDSVSAIRSLSTSSVL